MIRFSRNLVLFLYFISIVSINFCGAAISSPAHAQERFEKVKAVFLFKFTDYITWPNTDKSKLTLCTRDNTEFKDLLSRIANLQKSSLKIKNIGAKSPLGDCNMIYASDAASFADAAGKSILTVSDKKNFANNGGMIELRKTSKNVKLIINLKQLEKANLKASSRLLDLAEVIR